MTLIQLQDQYNFKVEILFKLEKFLELGLSLHSILLLHVTSEVVYGFVREVLCWLKPSCDFV